MSALEAAVEIMAGATSSFVQDPYATEALEALLAAGWLLSPPVAELKGRALLEALGPLVGPLRELRYRPTEEFADVTLEELESASRALLALAYSCQQGETVLRRARLARSST